jgi:hypothetical protein
MELTPDERINLHSSPLSNGHVFDSLLSAFTVKPNKKAHFRSSLLRSKPDKSPLLQDRFTGESATVKKSLSNILGSRVNRRNKMQSFTEYRSDDESSASSDSNGSSFDSKSSDNVIIDSVVSEEDIALM